MTKSEYMAVTLPMLEKWASTYRDVESQMAVLRATKRAAWYQPGLPIEAGFFLLRLA